MKPMLAASTDGADLKYPLLLSPKLDGVRAIVVGGVVMSRSMKPIKNKHVQRIFGTMQLEGLDGELIVGPPTAKDVYNQTVSGVMAFEGMPPVSFWVFDDATKLNDDFQLRYNSVLNRVSKYNHPRVRTVNHRLVKDSEELLRFEQQHLISGYEGVMLRHVCGQYKQGRSTLKEGWLMKLKRFTDGEAQVLGMTELMHNANEAETNELGYQERSSKKAGMVGKGIMGSLIVRDMKTGVEFEIGTGFTAGDRAWWWNKPNQIVANRTIVKYKHQVVGAKDKPRFPVFLGFRDKDDM